MLAGEVGQQHVVFASPHTGRYLAATHQTEVPQHLDVNIFAFHSKHTNTRTLSGVQEKNLNVTLV